MSEFLSFLTKNDIVLEEVKKGTRLKGSSKQYNPNPSFLGFRVWADGSIYPSKALVDRFELEYPQATIQIINKTEVEPLVEGATEEQKAAYEAALKKAQRREYSFAKEAFGLDLIDTSKWGQFPAGAPRGLLIAITPKTAPKVDMFAEVRYSDDGNPTVSVMDQGSETFGKKVLIPTIKEVYGVDLEAEDGPEYVDLNVVTSVNLKQVSSNGIFHFPKVIARGENAGKADYVRRENVDIFPIDIVAAVAAEPSTEAEQESAKEAGDANIEA